jgi:hypothetical protein
MLEISVAPGVWLRQRTRNRVFGWACVLAAAAFGGAAIACVAVLVVTGAPFLAVLAVLCGVPAAAAARVAPGCFKAGVLIREDVVIIRNPWRTWTIPAGEVERFECGVHTTMGNTTPGVLAILRDGSRVSVWSLASDGFTWTAGRDAARWHGVASGLTAAL